MMGAAPERGNRLTAACGAAYRGGVRTVELVCDAALDAAVRDAWRRLDAAGLPSLATHTHPTNRPHLTLAAADEFPSGAEERISAALAALPVAVRTDGVVFFEGKQAMAAWRLVADPALVQLQEAVWHALDGTDRNPLHEPARWMPHLSLARRVRPEQRAAVELVTRSGAAGRLTAGRSYDSITRTVQGLPER
jgi:2'-5' RNA ligase